MRDSRPIGVFDSGIGGLTVVKALRDLLPNERIFYLGDTARVPYGGKSANTVERYSLEMTNMLVDEDVKAIVIACNSASAVALPKLEKTLSVPVVGVIKPGAQAAINATRNRHIGVIGTRATIKSKLTDQIIARYLEPLMRDGVDTLVLGCTHYPLLVRVISRFVGAKVELVDSAKNCAIAVQQLLDRQSLRAPTENSGSLEVALTDAPDNFLRVARDALQLEIAGVQLREVIHGAGNVA